MFIWYYFKGNYLNTGQCFLRRYKNVIVGVIIIKKLMWLIGGLIIIFIATFGIATMKKHYTMKQIKEIPIQEQFDGVEEGADDSEIETAEEVTAEEDPVRYYLSEKVAKAMRLFFTKEINILAIGDSLTEGIGDEMENEGYVGILRDTINQEEHLVNIMNFGKQGNRTDQLLNRLEGEQAVNDAVKEADIILMTIGANDVMQVFKENLTNLTMEEFWLGREGYKERLQAIFTKLQELNAAADVYLIGFYNPFKGFFTDVEELEVIVDNWNQVGADVVLNNKHAYYIPTKDLFDNTSLNYLSDDHFHPNHLGYELMAERILQSITDEGEVDGTDQ